MPFALNQEYTLPEILRSEAPDGSYLPFADVLSQQVPLIEEGYWEQANDKTSHELLQVASEPTGTLTRINEGIPWEAVTTHPVREHLALLESMCRIDKRLVKKAPDPVRFRTDREKAHIRGMTKRFHDLVFFGGYVDATTKAVSNTYSADPRGFDGLRRRFNAAVTGSCTDGGGVTSTFSMYIIKWGVDGTMLLHPSDVSKGVETDDLKEQMVYDASTNPYTAYVTRFGWQFGLGIADPRAAKRLGKVNATVFPDSSSAGENWLIDLIENLPNGDTSQAAIYAGPQMMACMRKRLNTKANTYFTLETVWERPQLTFQGLPVIRVDSLGFDEAGNL